MSADLTREQAREQVARIIAAQRYHYGAAAADRDADAALTVLWPVVESLRADLAHAHTVIARHVEPRRGRVGGKDGQYAADPLYGNMRCRAELGDCCTGDAHTWLPAQGSRLPDRVDGNTPSDALYGDLTASNPAPGVSGRVDETGGSE